MNVTGSEFFEHHGFVKVFETEERAMTSARNGPLTSGDVVVVRQEALRGGTGMREMLGSRLQLGDKAMKTMLRCVLTIVFPAGPALQ